MALSSIGLERRGWSHFESQSTLGPPTSGTKDIANGNDPSTRALWMGGLSECREVRARNQKCEMARIAEHWQFKTAAKQRSREELLGLFQG